MELDNILTDIEQFKGMYFLPIYTLFNFTLEYNLNNSGMYYNSGVYWSDKRPKENIECYSLHVYSFMPEKTLIKVFDINENHKYDYILNNISNEKKDKLVKLNSSYTEGFPYSYISYTDGDEPIDEEITKLKQKYHFDMLNEFIKIGKKYINAKAKEHLKIELQVAKEIKNIKFKPFYIKD